MAIVIKIFLIMLAAFPALAIGADRAAAQGQAWCLITSNSGSSCGYYTFEQCLASRAGGSSHCVQNPNYSGNRSDATGRRREPRR